MRHFAFGVAVAVLLFFPLGGVRRSMSLSELSTLATSAPMPPPNQNALHLKKPPPPPPPRRRLSELSLSTWACSALHCTCNVRFSVSAADRSTESNLVRTRRRNLEPDDVLAEAAHLLVLREDLALGGAAAGELQRRVGAPLAAEGVAQLG